MKHFLINYKIKYVFIFQVLVCLFFYNISYPQTGDHQKDPRGKDSSLTHRQHMIHSDSPMVMPFSMDRVTHYFLKEKKGGTLLIRTKDPNDSSQIVLIRAHLKKEKELFSNADFKDPMTLHGKDMPGLHILSESKGKYNVGYFETPRGAKLIFQSDDPTVIAAIHDWFDAQLKDHGSDAKSRLN